MSFTKNDLETIKSKLKLSGEIEKKQRLLKKETITGVVVHFMKKRHLHAK